MKTRSNYRHVAAWAILCSVPWLVSMFPATASEDDIPKGQRIFDTTCSGCHGYDGEGQGALGFKLTAPEIAAWTDEELANKIRYGNLERGMPRFADIFLAKGQMTDFGNFQERIDFRALIAYIRVLQRHAREGENRRAARIRPPDPSIPGNPEAGRALFNGKARCASCHTSSGDEIRSAPDLAGIGSRLDRDAIYESIVEPSRKIHPDFQRKELRFPRGKGIQGRFRHETSDAIELYDRQKNVWTQYSKKDVLFYRTLRASAMPEGLLDSLEEAERSDLLAYLDSL